MLLGDCAQEIETPSDVRHPGAFCFLAATAAANTRLGKGPAASSARPSWNKPSSRSKTNGGCHSERRKLFSVLNERTERESSEYSLAGSAAAADFDSAIRRFDPSRPSHRSHLTASDTQPISSARRYRNSGSSCTTAAFRILSPQIAACRLSTPHSLESNVESK